MIIGSNQHETTLQNDELTVSPFFGQPKFIGQLMIENKALVRVDRVTDGEIGHDSQVELNNRVCDLMLLTHSWQTINVKNSTPSVSVGGAGIRGGHAPQDTGK